MSHECSQASMATACDCIYQLVQQRQADAKQLDDLAKQRHRLMCDLATAESRSDRLEDELEVARRKIQSLTAQEQKAAAEFKAQIKKLRAERDELSKHVIALQVSQQVLQVTQQVLQVSQQALQQVKAQQAFELRKEKREFVKLQEKLASCVGGKRTPPRQPGVDIVNLNPQSEGRQRATWGGKKSDSNFYKRMMEAHERQLRAVGEDSKQLMAVIRSMQDVYALPPNMACPHIMDLHQRIVTAMRDLVQRAAQQQAASAAVGGGCTGGDSNEMAALREELEACRERLAEQGELLICNYMYVEVMRYEVYWYML
ncbi:unnamed protein product [Closterium sp. NIES-65]|nr:unnamed protein product [Closterium sp. NIES-65]